MSFPRYPAYKNSGVEWLGEVPEHWEVRRLKLVCHAFPSNVDKKSYDGQESVRLCNYVDVYYNDEITADLPFMDATASKEEITKFTLLPGDTIITKDSETADDIAIAAYVPQKLSGVVCGYHLTIVRPLGNMCGRFVKRLFDSHFLKAQFKVSANGLTRVGLSQYSIDNALLPVPPAPEQSAIAAFLDRETGKIDALVAEQERLIDLLKEKRQAVISHAVTKGLDPSAPLKDSGIDWLGQVPEHWAIVSLRRVLIMIEQGWSPPSEERIPEEGEWGVLKTSAVKHGTFNKEEVKTLSSTNPPDPRYAVRDGDLLMIRGSGSPALVGGVAYVEHAPPQQILPDLLYRLDYDNRKTAGAYLAYLLQSPSLRYQIEVAARGIDILKIAQPSIADLIVTIPPLPEQAAIVTYLDDQTTKFDTLITEAQRAIELLKEHRSALISAAVTGKIDVRGVAPAPQEAA